MSNITIEECILYALRGRVTIINDGKVVGFEKEEIPTGTVNRNGD